jgi:hypothetical protein
MLPMLENRPDLKLHAHNHIPQLFNKKIDLKIEFLPRTLGYVWAIIVLIMFFDRIVPVPVFFKIHSFIKTLFNIYTLISGRC